MTLKTFCLLLCVLGLACPVACAEDPIFSGPQPGEQLASFDVQGVFDELASKTFDPVAKADGEPLFLIFVHELTRPSVGMTRLVMNYAATRQRAPGAKDGLTNAVVFLADDATAMQERLKRARHALPEDVLLGISADGVEGPGAYGLNRHVTLTILVGKEGKTTANFALVQPSIAADAPKVLQALVEVVGGEAPSLADLGAPMQRNMRMEARLRQLVGPLLRKDATADQVAEAAKKIEQVAERDAAFAKTLGIRARRIVASEKFDDYATAPAREFLSRWADKYKSGE